MSALLAAEITARCGRRPAQVCAKLAHSPTRPLAHSPTRPLAHSLGESVADRVEAPATAAQGAQLAALTPAGVPARELAGEAITAGRDHAPGNGGAIGGIKVV